MPALGPQPLPKTPPGFSRHFQGVHALIVHARLILQLDLARQTVSVRNLPLAACPGQCRFVVGGVHMVPQFSVLQPIWVPMGLPHPAVHPSPAVLSSKAAVCFNSWSESS